MKKIVATNAPKPLGPYSHAIESGNFIFCSGQTPINPETMKVEEPTIEGQTERALKNIQLVLAARNLTMANVIKVNVYMTDLDEFQRMNGVYEIMFAGHKPVRTTIEVRRLPMNCKIEIECIAELLI